jgi:hypothetical protein
MKFLSIALIILLFLTSCKKHKNINPVDQLPSETQTGAGTFGCLINGKVFKPKGPSLSPILSSNYQYIYSPSPNGFVFQVSATNNVNECEISNITVGLDSGKVSQGGVYELKEMNRGNAVGRYMYFPSCNTSQIIYETTSESKGQLIITKFDEINQIASGTFWFIAVNDKGDTLKITDGRFDVHYTR